MGETVSGAVEAGAAELALVRPFVGVNVHVLAKVRPRVKALRRFAKFALKNIPVLNHVALARDDCFNAKSALKWYNSHQTVAKHKITLKHDVLSLKVGILSQGG